MRFVNYKDRRPVAAGLKPSETAVNEDSGSGEEHRGLDRGTGVQRILTEEPDGLSTAELPDRIAE